MHSLVVVAVVVAIGRGWLFYLFHPSLTFQAGGSNEKIPAEVDNNGAVELSRGQHDN